MVLVAVLLFVPSAVGQVDPGEEPDGGTDLVDGVEVPSLRTQNARTYRLEDGRFTTVASAGPVNFRGSDGRWQPIDNTLVASDRGGFAWENRANAYSVLLSGRPGREPVRFEHEGAWVSFSLRNAPSVVPTIDKETARVLLGGGLQLRWIAGNAGLKEEIVLADLQAASSFVFDLRLSAGLRPEARTDGSIDFVKANGEHAFSFAAPYMVDSSGKEEGFSDAVSYQLEKEEGGYVLRVVADREWLADPARVWPVTIDPTITIEQPWDCHMTDGNPTVSACGQVDLKLGLGGGSIRRLLLKFTLPPQLEGHTVTDADLALWCEGGTTTNDAFIDVRRATRSWTNGATWNKYDGTNNWTSPGGDFGGTDAATRGTNCSFEGWKLWTSAAGWSMAGLVNDWLDGTYANQGVLLKQQGENINNLLTFTATNDAANPSHWPELRLTFSNTAPPVPTLDAPAAAATVPMITPVLTATDGAGDPVRDADGDELSYQFEVGDLQGGSFSPQCASEWLPTTNTWTTAPADCALEDGDTYYWRARAKDPFQTSGWSAERALDVRLAKLGENEMWPMWEHEKLAVNQVNGNAVLSLPGPSYQMAVGSMSASVTHNSLDSEDRGLGAGWTLDAGDALSDPPSKLIDHGLMDHDDGYDAVEIVIPGGESAFYSRVGESNTYISEPGDGSQLSKNEDGTWILLSEDEAIYTFGVADDLTDSAGLTGAELSSATPGEGKLTYSFSTDGSLKKLTMIEDEAGRQLAFSWNSLAPTLCPDALLCVEGPDGEVWEYVGDSGGGTGGRLVTINDGTRDLFAVTYESPTSSKIVKVQNANDLDPTNASPGYDGDHALLIGYDGSGRVDEVSDGPISSQTPDTSTWTFEYLGPALTPRTGRQADGRTTVTPPNQQGLPSPAASTVYYDSRGREIEIEDVLGMITAEEYNELDQRVWSEDAEGNRTDFVWDEASSKLLSETGPDPDGGGALGRPVTTYRYDESAIGTSGTAGPALEGLQASYYTNVNLAGRPHGRTNDANVDFATGGGWPNLPGAQTTNFSVRWTGNLIVATAGEYTFSTVATDGTRLTVGDVAAIDIADRVGAVTTTSSEPISLSAGIHRVVLEYFAQTTSGAQVELRWVGPGISDQVIPASALQPAWMNRTSVVSPTGTVSFSHFAEPASEKPDYELTKLGGTDVITSYEYDSVGRVVEKVTPNGNAGRTIDTNGNLTGSPDLDYATTWEYYGLSALATPPATCNGAQAGQAGLLKSMTHAGMTSTTTVYDEAGRPASVTSGAGIRCETYDAEGRLVSSKAPTAYGGTTYQTVTYTYDPAGQRLTASAGALTTSTVYNEADHILLETDSHGAEVAYTYDGEGSEVTREATPTAATLTTEYQYDAENRLTNVTDPADQEYSFTYDDRGNLKTVQYPNGTFSWMDYNDAGWLTNVYHRHGTLPATLPGSVPSDASPIADYAYTYDIAGRKTQEVRSGGGLTTETTSYTSYDALGRLAEVVLPDGTCRKYLFDLNSNRTEVKEGPSCGSVATVETYAYSTTKLDQLTSVTETGQPAVSFTYTTGGEVATRGSDTLNWDGRGRHTEGTFGTSTVNYGFDPLGFRHERTVGSQTTRYLSGGLFEKAGSSITHTAVAGPDGDLAHYQGRADLSPPRSFLYYNGHGDLAAEADQSGTRTAAYSYDPFGKLRSGAVPADATSERFTGKWDKKLDTTSNLVEMGARPYDQALGRFYAVDPIEGGALNLYDYAGQDPLNLYDLEGTHYRLPCISLGIFGSNCRSTRSTYSWYLKAVTYSVCGYWTLKKTWGTVWSWRRGIGKVATRAVVATTVVCGAWYTYTYYKWARRGYR